MKNTKGSGIKDASNMVSEMCVHDYEDTGFGAQGIITIGGRGTGKTTMALRLLQRVSYLESDKITKADYMTIYHRRLRKEAKMLSQGYSLNEIRDALPRFPCRELPETVLYSGREYDYWHNFLEKNIWEGDFQNPKPLRIHLPKGEEYHFVVEFGDGLKDLILDGLVSTYSDSKDLIKNLKEGGINVFYPPKDFTFAPEIMENFKRRNLSDKTLDVKHKNWMNFELVYYLMQYRMKRHITWFADEVHSLIPSMARDFEWHVLDWFSRDIDPELRRCHISSFGNAHKCTNVDSRHMNLAEWYIWTGGAQPDKRYSMIKSPSTVMNCHAGRCIVERKGFGFGYFDYERLVGQLPKIRVVQGDIKKIKLI